MPGVRTDAEIVEDSLREPAAFAAIFDRHYDAVFRFAERRVGYDAAREIASDVFMTAFRLRDKFAPDTASARPWLFGIAARKVMHEHRRFARSTNALRRLGARRIATELEADTVARAVDAASQAEALRAALATLDPQSRELLLLVTWEDLTYAEAAAAMDLPIGTVRSRVHRARRKLAEQLGVDDEVSETEPEAVS
ncbi:MAG: hypothetical protein QOK28_1928 [Actinomycetota bacterium]